MFGDSKRETIISTGGILDNEEAVTACIRETATPLPYIFGEGVGIIPGPVTEGRTPPLPPCPERNNSRHPVRH